MDHVVCAELAWAAARAGRPVLRFNFRGVGASQGQRGGERPRGSRMRRRRCDCSGRTPRQLDVAVAAVGRICRARPSAWPSEHPGVVGLVLVSPPAARAGDRLGVPLLCIVGEDEPGQAGLAALAAAGGWPAWSSVPGADARFQRNLPEVGRLALRWLERTSKHPES